MNRKIKIKFHLIFILVLVPLLYFSSFSVKAAVLGEIRNFYIDSLYDFQGRKEAPAILVLETNKLYFYIDNSLWQSFSPSEKSEIISNLSKLSDEFNNKIYPILTLNYGSEWNPGIDNDPKITILFHPLKRKAGGYFNNGNEYSKFEATTSNEREMVYLNSDYLASPLVKQILAHEFTHLITFYQKEKLRNIEEDVWLNEARAEYAPTLLGYDDIYQGSNLQKRVIDFLKNPSNSLIDWENSSSDYGVLNIFIQYLVDHYGIKILNDSLHSNKTGINSLNYALAQNGYQEDFYQIFTNWTIAVLVNDCSLGAKYCYKNNNLKNLKVIPINNFIASISTSILSANYSTKNFSSYWNKISGGGEGDLTFEFLGDLKIPYRLCDLSGKCSINFLDLGEDKYGRIFIKDFNAKYSSLTIIPSIQKIQNSSDYSTNFSFSWNVQIKKSSGEEDLISQLLSQIESLKKQIAEVQAKIDAIIGRNNTCTTITGDLYLGLTNNSQVICLQIFLKNQGIDIYPEGLITGNFLSLTKTAVIRFQEKYINEILTPLGLKSGTGYVGPKTREKINTLINYSRELIW